MKLTTRAKLKAHIGIPAANTTKDALLDTIIEGVSGFIETTTNRVFDITEYTEVLDGTPLDEIFLKQYPLIDVLSLFVNGTEIDLDAEEEAETVVIDNETGSVYREGGFGSGRKAVRVTYTAGYVLPEEAESGVDVSESGVVGEDLPAALEGAAIRLSARVYERRTAEGVSSVSPTGLSVTYKDAIDADIVTVLQAYTKRRI
jgi:hypothetical protein